MVSRVVVGRFFHVMYVNGCWKSLGKTAGSLDRDGCRFPFISRGSISGLLCKFNFYIFSHQNDLGQTEKSHHLLMITVLSAACSSMPRIQRVYTR